MISKETIEQFGKAWMPPGWLAEIEEQNSCSRPCIFIISCKELPHKVEVILYPDKNISFIDQEKISHITSHDDLLALTKIWYHMQRNKAQREVERQKSAEYSKHRNQNVKGSINKQ